MKNIFEKGGEKKEGVNIVQNLFEQYKQKRNNATEEDFYREVVTDALIDLGFDDDGPVKNFLLLK